MNTTTHTKDSYREGYMRGFQIGESIARSEHERAARAETSRAIGAGVLIGTGLGVVIALIVAGWL